MNRRLVPVGLTVALGLQAVAFVFFMFDAAEELSHDPSGLHPWSEGAVACALGLGMAFVAQALVQSLRRGRAQASALAIAVGEFRRLIETHFDRWNLTDAEREVAFLSLQGYEMDRIAALRGAATGTVRAQLTKIYAKSGTANRAQLSAVFVQLLLKPEAGHVNPRSDTAPT